MNFLNRLSVLFFSLMGLTALQAQEIQYPFPQHVKYAAGVIIPSHLSRQALDEYTLQFYRQWKNKYISEDSSGNYFVRVDDAIAHTYSVSEGQGYGMLVTVMMAGADPDAKKIFDGLFRYCKSHPSKRHPLLMSWKQSFNHPGLQGSAATDADIDIAYALILAHAQWKSDTTEHYIEYAKSMIKAIKEQDIHPNTFALLLSNDVEKDSRDFDDMRVSDFIPEAFSVFGHLDGGEVWYKVNNHNYLLFQKMQSQFSPGVGLLPDFIQHISTRPRPVKANYLESSLDGAYNYNACRFPWRIATDFIVHGDNRAKQLLTTLNDWIRSTTNNIPDNISAGYYLNGTDVSSRNFEALSFIGSFAVSAMVDSKNQVWLNALWDYLNGFGLKEFDYYDNSIKMIQLILLSGNYWEPLD